MIFDREIYMEIPSINVAGLSDYMWIDPVVGSLITAIVVDEQPMRFINEYSSYKEIKPGLVEVRSCEGGRRSEHWCNVKGNTVWWTVIGKSVGWRIIPFEMVPELARRALLRGREKMGC